MILNKKQLEIEELAKKVGETQDIKDIRQQFCGFKAGITFAKEEILNEIEYICETEGRTNHDNPQHVITIERLLKLVKDKLK